MLPLSESEWTEDIEDYDKLLSEIRTKINFQLTQLSQM